jgi:hypothetical protein
MRGKRSRDQRGEVQGEKGGVIGEAFWMIPAGVELTRPQNQIVDEPTGSNYPLA